MTKRSGSQEEEEEEEEVAVVAGRGGDSGGRYFLSLIAILVCAADGRACTGAGRQCTNDIVLCLATAIEASSEPDVEALQHNKDSGSW
ncbi:hypothetical protein PIB30_029401 [Stylosanthes scabra]|uniref:Uncharacterized protein n=1 Tax=Stylosanthes scabra TaxID=79078 RepID=A0ABU6VA56_9FABA|nr:hypothetical protein [Stylosanthes scabra]